LAAPLAHLLRRLLLFEKILGGKLYWQTFACKSGDRAFAAANGSAKKGPRGVRHIFLW